MQRDLTAFFPFKTEKTDVFEELTALSGRVTFRLLANPNRAVLHTRQVELNGFIHSMLTGTEFEERGYCYFAFEHEETSDSGACHRSSVM